MKNKENADDLFRIVVEASPTGMIVVDAAGKIVLVNSEALRLFGYERDELMHRSIEQLVPQRHQQSHTSLRSNYSDNASTRPIGAGRDLAGRRKDGSEFPLEIGLNPVTTQAGRCVIAAVTDLTARKAAEALREHHFQSQARLAAIVTSSDYAIVSHDLSGTVNGWNAGAEALFGYSEQEILGKSVKILFPESRLAEDEEIMRGLTEQGRSIKQSDTTRLHKSGELINVAVTISPIYDNGRVIGVSKVAWDISERISAENELRTRSQELARSNLELQQFAYSASHDLQEPLRAVAGCIELLRRRYEGQLDARADEYMRHAVEGAQRMKQLIEDILSLSRVGISTLKPTTINFNDVVKQAIGNLIVTIGETGASIDCEVLPNLPADQTQITQLFQNLITNAIKFRRNDPPRVSIRCNSQKNEHIFSVSDNGIGIEARHYERIFAMFQRLHGRSDYPGTGIGLALCAKIVAAHQGRIWVESQPGIGSTFFFSLPASQSKGQTDMRSKPSRSKKS